MARTINLRRQHDAAVTLIAEIVASFAHPPPTEGQAYAIGMTLARLTGLLRIHFAVETQTLYPLLLRSAAAAATAARFQRETERLEARYAAFAARWHSGRAIAAGFDRFRADATTIFAAITDRIKHENMTLYPLAETITGDPAAGARGQ